MRKIICLALSVVILSAAIKSVSSFADAANDAWYKTAVDFVSENGIMPGYDSSFNPTEPITRAEYVDALYKASKEISSGFTVSFTDVSSESTFYNAIGWAEKNNITSGIGNNLFAPDDYLTREMSMTFLYRALKHLDIAPQNTSEDLLSKFTDKNDVSDWAAESMNTLVNMKIVNGTDENKIEPQRVLNNAEAATVIYNVFSLKAPASAEQEISSESNFESKVFLFGDNKKIGYWLFTPKNATEQMPLIIYLHGSHGQGDDLNIVLQEVFAKMLSGGEFDNTSAYIAIPQLPSEYKSWRNIHTELIGLIDDIVNVYSINKDNISLMGYSMGGTGTVNLAAEYPGYFSKIAFLSGSAINIENMANSLSGTPVWAFVGSEDVIVKPETAIQLVETLKQNGGNAQITVFDGADHIAVPELVFSEYKNSLINWLVGQ